MAPVVILATNNNLTFNTVAQSGVITNIQVTVVSNQRTGKSSNHNQRLHQRRHQSDPITGLNTASASKEPAACHQYHLYRPPSSSPTLTNEGNAVFNDNFDTIRPVLVWEAEDFNYNVAAIRC